MNEKQMTNEIKTTMTVDIPKFSERREEIVESFIKAGIELFCRDQSDSQLGKVSYKESNVSFWVYMTSQENAVALSHVEFHEIVRKVYAAATNVIYNGSELTVGKLKEQLAGLPDNMPVFYQRIEDTYFQNNNWTTTKFVWEMNKARESHTVADGYSGDYEGDVEYVKNNPSEGYDIKEIDGVNYLREFSYYIPAHSAWTVKNDEGQSAFVINAHY